MIDMQSDIIETTVLNPGDVTAEALLLDEPLSFWGGFDPVEGRIIDRHHPQAGAVVSAKVLVMPGSRGSAGTPAGVAESLRRGCGPVAFVLARADVNITIGAIVADRLYGSATPVVVAEGADYGRIANGAELTISTDGKIVISR